MQRNRLYAIELYLNLKFNLLHTQFKPFYIEMTRFPLITEGRDEAMHTPNRL